MGNREEERKNVAELLFLAKTSILTALTFVITVVFSAYIPSTRGYFNFGEVGVYIAGLLGGPLTGIIAGGVGSMLADLALAPQYAPGTLLIKGIEGGIVGWTAQKIRALPERKKRVGIGLAVVFVMSIYLLWLLMWSFRGSIQINFTTPTVSLHPFQAGFSTHTWVIQWWAGLVGALVLAFVLMGIAIYLAIKGLYLYVPCLFGGPVMIVGYFLYEAFILGYGVLAAAVEIPFNIGQMTIGALVSVPVISSLEEAGLDVTD